jgi:hypothetical protein
MLTWNSNVGQAINEARTSVKLNGLPGVMVKAQKDVAMLKRRPIKNKKSLLT